MLLVLAGEFESFDFLSPYNYDCECSDILSAELMHVKWKKYEPVLFAAVGHTKVEITKNLIKILERYTIDNIILMGNCGVTDKSIGKICDIAISNQVYQHDVQFHAIGYEHTVLPIRDGESSFMKADPWLIELACNAAESLGDSYDVGIMASGDQFVASSTIAAYLRYNYDTSYIDSESAAISEVANALKYPFVVVKGISNLVCATGGDEFHKNEKLADAKAGNVVMAMIQQMEQT